MSKELEQQAREWFRIYPPPDAGWYVEMVLIPGLIDLLTRVQAEARLDALEEAAAYVDDWHSEVDSPFAGDCIRAHFALAQAAAPATKEGE